jgi:hypothetical protein
LIAQEDSPRRVYSPRCWPYPITGQDPTDRPGTDPMTEPHQLTQDPPMPPPRILPRQAHNQFADFLGNGWTTCPLWIGPLHANQAAVPGQQCRRRDEPTQPQRTWQQAGESGQDRPIRPRRTWSADLAAQHSNLVSQRQHLDDHHSPAAREQHEPSEHPNHDQIQQTEHHGYRSCLAPHTNKTPGHNASIDFWHGTGLISGLICPTVAASFWPRRRGKRIRPGLISEGSHWLNPSPKCLSPAVALLSRE